MNFYTLFKVLTEHAYISNCLYMWRQSSTVPTVKNGMVLEPTNKIRIPESAPPDSSVVGIHSSTLRLFAVSNCSPGLERDQRHVLGEFKYLESTKINRRTP